MWQTLTSTPVMQQNESTTTTTINKVSILCCCGVCDCFIDTYVLVVIANMSPRKKRRTVATSQEELLVQEQEEDASGTCKKNTAPAVITSDVSEFEVAFLKKYQFMWHNTSCPTVSDYLGKARCGIRWRRTPHTTKPGKKFSSNVFSSRKEAEEGLFDFRMSKESWGTRLKLEQWRTARNVMAQQPTLVENNILAEIDARKPRATTVKKLAFSGPSKLQAQLNVACTNPKLVDFNVEDIMDDVKHAGKKVWKAYKGSQLRQLVKLQKLQNNQLMRKALIEELEVKISNRDWINLVKGAYDSEIADALSLFDKEHALSKAKHVTSALKILYEWTKNNNHITWSEACNKAAIQNFNEVTSRTIRNWYRDMTFGLDIGRFTPSFRGATSTSAISPFKENQELTLNFKAWARTSMFHLTIRRAQEYINDTLLKDWSKEELKTYNIAFPVSTHVTSCWMKEMGFEYRYRKNHIILIGMKMKMLWNIEKIIFMIILIRNLQNSVGLECR